MSGDHHLMTQATTGAGLVHDMVVFEVRLRRLLLLEEMQIQALDSTPIVLPTTGAGRIRLRDHPRLLIIRALLVSDSYLLMLKTSGITALTRTARFDDP